MTNEDLKTAALVIIIIAIIIMTLRAIYGIVVWKGNRKNALLQAVVYPTGGFILMMIIAVAVPGTSSERMAIIEAEKADAEKAAAVEAAADKSRKAEVEKAERAEKAKKAEAERAELEVCRQDLRCWGERYSIDAAVRCRRPVERLAKYDMRWSDGWTETKFPRMRWENQDKGLITYIGDKAQFQNGFGAWQNVIYFCTYDPATDSAVSAEMEEGRLP